MASLFASVRGHLPRCSARLAQASVRCQSGPGGFDSDPFNSPAGGFGGPQGGFGGPQGGFGGPQGGFGGPQGGFGAPQGGFGGPQGGFGGPQGGFGGPQGGFGGPQGGFGAPQGAFGGTQGGFAGPPGSYSFRPVRPRAPIPDKEPFGLMLLRTGGMADDDLLDLFKVHNPTHVKKFSESQSHIYFNNRDDLMGALALNGKEEIRFIRVVTSLYLHRLSKIPEGGPFRLHLRNLPANCAQVDLMETFKDFNPIDGIILTSRTNQTRYAFMEVKSREDLMKALDVSGTEEVKGIIVNPTDTREA